MSEEKELKDITSQMPVGLICANDEMADDLMRKLLGTGIRIPHPDSAPVRVYLQGELITRFSTAKY